MNTAEFKDSPLGPIPQDWEVKRLGDEARINRGGSPRPIESWLTTSVDGINWIKIGDVAEGAKYICSTAERIMPEAVQFSRTVKSGDFLLSNSMSFGRPYILKISGCIHDGWLTIQDYKDTFDCEYLYYILGSEAVFQQYVALADGSSVKNLNKDKVEKVLVPCPPLPEQQRIAEALGEVDKLIESLDEQIEKKRLIAKGVAHDLLSGKKRLPGFAPLGGRMQDRGRDSSLPEGWVMKRLGDCVEINQIGDQIPDEFVYIDLESVKNGCLVQNNVVMRRDAPSRAQRQFAFGDVLFQTVRPYQKNNLFVNFDASKFVASTGYAVLRERDGVSRSPYIYAYLHLDSFVAQVLDKCTGTSYPAINPNALAGIEIALPEPAEQQAIADTLSEQDAAIAALEAKREKYARIKEGMMRDLLTGKVRI